MGDCNFNHDSVMQQPHVSNETKSSTSDFSELFFNSLPNLSDSVFQNKDLSDQQQCAIAPDSSLSLIDLEAVDKTDILTMSKADSSDASPPNSSGIVVWVNKHEVTRPNSKLDLQDSAVIKKETDNQIVLPIISPETKNESISCNQDCASLLDTVSPIYPTSVMASTPHRNERFSPNPEGGANGDGVLNLTSPSPNQDVELASGDAPPIKLNETYDTQAAHARNETFLIGENQVNETFVKANSEASEEVSGARSVRSEQHSSNLLSSTTGCSLEGPKNVSDSLFLSKDQKETKRATNRKPLTTLNSDSRTKPTTTSQAQRRGSRVQGPRMNAAAMSRILARSPQKSRALHDENHVNSLKPPCGKMKSSRNVQSRTQAIDKKALLQQPSFKLRPTVSSETAKKSIIARNVAAVSSNKLHSKKKSESSNETGGRSTKLENNARPNVSSSSLTRNSATLRSTRLPKPQVTSYHQRSLTGTSHNDDVIRKQTTARSRVNPMKLRNAAKNQQLRITDGPSDIKRSLCPIALATLLDYVVNKIDGLSAPQLSAEKQQLQLLVSKQEKSNASLSSRVSNLEDLLSQSREAHKHDVEAAVKCHKEEVTHLIENHKKNELELERRLDEISADLTKQIAEHQQAVQVLQDENKKNIEELTSQHTEELAQLRLEWSEEREEWERETLELQNSIDVTVKAKVEELIQPYINSYAENKSLRAVLEIKNAEQHKLKAELSQQNDRLQEIDVLREHVTRLQQRNEDLQTQVDEKNVEQRGLKNDLDQARRDLNEQIRKNKNQQQRIDELEYLRDFSTPSPASPFNPVFTLSPTTSGTRHPGLRTPTRNNAKSDSSATPGVNGSS